MIENNEAIRFSDEKIRVYADKMAQAYHAAKRMISEWTARGMSSIIVNDAGEFLADSAYGTDGTDGDGRPVVSGAELTTLYNRANELIADYEASSNAKLNQILNVAVNTGE